jgi:hypothetical protein
VLKAIVDSIDDLPEPIKALYKQIEDEGDLKGKWLLQVEGVNGFSLEDVAGLKNALVATKGELEQARAAVDGFKGLDAKKVRKDLQELERLKKLNPETEADRLAEAKIAAQVEALSQQHATEIEVRNKRETTLMGEINRVLVDNEARAAILEAKGVPELLLPTMRSRLKVVETDGKFGVQVLNDRGNQDYVVKGGNTVPSTIADLVAKFKADPKFGRAFDASERSGGGANPPGQGGGGRPNPWAKDTFNLTEQMKLLRSDPALAAAMKQQAGITS